MKKCDIMITVKLSDILDSDYLCDKYGINPYCITEGLCDENNTEQISL